jgi:acyl-CoA synthetase (AMP-forming)/AMP-acid ligase II
LISEYAARKGQTPIVAPSLRLIASAGAPLDNTTKRTAETAFARPLYNGYGITECSPTVSLTPLDAAREDCSVGMLLPGIEARLISGDREVAECEEGELFVRGPGVMKGYYNAPGETAAAVDRDGWFRTGDLARFEAGSLFITGRAKELIIRFGFNVYPAEVESVLNAHPLVALSAVIGRQKSGSEEIVAFVTPVSGAEISADELAAFAAEKLAPYKRPSHFYFVSEMPMSPGGKVLKTKLLAAA